MQLKRTNKHKNIHNTIMNVKVYVYKLYKYIVNK